MSAGSARRPPAVRRPATAPWSRTSRREPGTGVAALPPGRLLVFLFPAADLAFIVSSADRSTLAVSILASRCGSTPTMGAIVFRAAVEGAVAVSVPVVGGGEALRAAVPTGGPSSGRTDPRSSFLRVRRPVLVWSGPSASVGRERSHEGRDAEQERIRRDELRPLEVERNDEQKPSRDARRPDGVQEVECREREPARDWALGALVELVEVDLVVYDVQRRVHGGESRYRTQGRVDEVDPRSGNVPVSTGVTLSGVGSGFYTGGGDTARHGGRRCPVGPGRGETRTGGSPLSIAPTDLRR